MEQQPTTTHLVILIHGLMGSPYDFEHAEEILKQQNTNNNEILDIVRVDARSTLDGVEAGGRRAFNQIVQRLVSIKDAMMVNRKNQIIKLSLVGHSLGGFYARHAAYLLFITPGILNGVKLMVFCTIATPHVGIRKPCRNFFNIMSHVVCCYLCQSTRELILEDNLMNPLLLRMTSKEYLKVLEMFEIRLLYSNVFYDTIVPYSTAALQLWNPYRPPNHKNILSSLFNSGTSDIEIIQDFNITKLSHENPVFSYEQIHLSTFAITDNTLKREQLVTIFQRLRNLKWFNYDVIIPSISTHEQVIAKRTSGNGVILHLYSFLTQHQQINDIISNRKQLVLPITNNKKKKSPIQFIIGSSVTYYICLMLISIMGNFLVGTFVKFLLLFILAFIVTFVFIFDNMLTMYYHYVK
jgi:hypothetical protein